MKRKKYLTLTAILVETILWVSCKDEYQRKYFNNTQYLIAEKIEVNEIFKPSFILLKNNTLIFSAYRSPEMLYFYSLPDLKHLYSIGQKGNGPEDFFLFPMFCKSFADDVYIWGYKPTQIKQFSITQSGELIFKKNIDLALYESFNQMHIMRDSLLIYSAIPSEFSIKKYNIHTNTIEGKIDIKKDDHTESFFYSNRGYVAVNDSSIIYTYVYKNQIDIYNLDDLKLRKRINGVDNKERIIVGDFENNINHYVSVLAGKKYFYALYSGSKPSNENDYVMEVFNYDGEPVVRYLFDIVPFLFEVDEENGYIYGYNSSYEDYLLRYKL